MGSRNKTTESGSGEEYEVDSIVNHKYSKKGIKYQLRWKGYSFHYDTWVLESEMHCDELVEAYWKNIEHKPGNETPSSSSRTGKQQGSSTRKARAAVSYKEDSVSSTEDFVPGAKRSAKKSNVSALEVEEDYEPGQKHSRRQQNMTIEQQEEEDDNGGAQGHANPEDYYNMNSTECFVEMKAIAIKDSPPYESTPEPEVAPKNAKSPAHESTAVPNETERVVADRVEAATRVVQNREPKSPTPEKDPLEEFYTKWLLELHNRPRERMAQKPIKAPEGKINVQDLFSGTFEIHKIATFPECRSNILIEKVPSPLAQTTPEEIGNKTWVRSVEVKIPEDVYRDGFLDPLHQTISRNIKDKDAESDDKNEMIRKEYLAQKHYIEQRVLSWDFTKNDLFQKGKKPLKILAVVCETFINEDANETSHKYYGVIQFKNRPGEAQQMPWDELCEKCPELMEHFKEAFMDHKKMMNGFEGSPENVNDDNRFWMDEYRKFGYNY